MSFTNYFIREKTRRYNLKYKIDSLLKKEQSIKSAYEEFKDLVKSRRTLKDLSVDELFSLHSRSDMNALFFNLISAEIARRLVEGDKKE